MIRHAAIVLVVTAGCARRALPIATEADAVRTGTTVAALERGRKLVLGHCGGCHQPPQPSERVAAAWPAQVDEMAERAALTAAEARLVVQYLTAFAKDQAVTRP